MKKHIFWMTMMALGVGHLGCGGNTDPSTAQSTPRDLPAAAQSTPSLPNLPSQPMASNATVPNASNLDAMVPMNALNLKNPTKPEEVVAAFLDGMRSGNATVIESLLSTRARKEIADKGLDIAPIGSPQAQFEIGVPQLADPNDPNTMLVTSNWVEPGTNGQSVGQYEVVWALIKEPTGWRICEMAVDTHLEGEEIQVVNFENLSDVVPPDAAAPTGPTASDIPRTASLPTAGSLPPSSALGGAPLSGPAANPAGLPPLPPSFPPSGNAGPTSLPSSSLPPAAFPPSGFPPASLPPASGLPGGLPSSSSSLPPLPGGPIGGSAAPSGGLPPLPPAGFGSGR